MKRDRFSTISLCQPVTANIKQTEYFSVKGGASYYPQALKSKTIFTRNSNKSCLFCSYLRKYNISISMYCVYFLFKYFKLILIRSSLLPWCLHKMWVIVSQFLEVSKLNTLQAPAITRQVSANNGNYNLFLGYLISSIRGCRFTSYTSWEKMEGSRALTARILKTLTQSFQFISM